MFVDSKAEQRNSSVGFLNIILQASSYIGAHIFMHYFNVLNYSVADYDCVKCFFFFFLSHGLRVSAICVDCCYLQFFTIILFLYFYITIRVPCVK